MSDTSSNSSSSSLVNNSEEVELNKQIKMCCILDCVNCLMTLHRDAFADEENRKSLYEIQDACSSCLVKLLKLYKVIIFATYLMKKINVNHISFLLF